MAINPTLINRFIGISSTAHCGDEHKFRSIIFVPWRIRALKKAANSGDSAMGARNRQGTITNFVPLADHRKIDWETRRESSLPR
jgi:hypothetical protein